MIYLQNINQNNNWRFKMTKTLKNNGEQYEEIKYNRYCISEHTCLLLFYYMFFIYYLEADFS